MSDWLPPIPPDIADPLGLSKKKETDEMKKEYAIIVFFLLSKFALMGQEKSTSFYDERSISLFNEIINRDSNSSSYFLYEAGYNPIRYELDDLNCFSLIFTEEGNFHYRDYCPHDYGTYSDIGTYKNIGDTVFLKADLKEVPSFGNRIGFRNGCIKNILHQNLLKDTLSKVVIEEENGDPLKFEGWISYYKNPKFLSFRKHSMELNLERRNNELSINNIITNYLVISKYPNDRFYNQISLDIMQKWKMYGKEITIQLWDKPLMIIRTNEMPFLYKWNWKKKKYEKIHKLVHKFEDEG